MIGIGWLVGLYLAVQGVDSLCDEESMGLAYLVLAVLSMGAEVWGRWYDGWCSRKAARTQARAHVKAALIQCSAVAGDDEGDGDA